jgi:hypothetical protein
MSAFAIALWVISIFFAGPAPAGSPRAPSPSPPSQQPHQSRAEAEKIDVHIAGEVTRGKIFQQDIGHGLVFRLAPSPGSPDLGWKIEIVPKSDPGDDPIEFSAIATPPYRMYNARYLEVSFGTSAKEAVATTPRVFYFVQSVDDEHRAEECLNAALYPTNVSDEEKVRVVAEQDQIQLGKGELRILKSRIGRSKTLTGEGTIDWVRFDVDLEFSPGLTMANILARIARPQ